jgi:hypothetical protein
MNLKELVNNENVLNTFVNLSFRWEDEQEYEDFNDYAEVMGKSVAKNTGSEISDVTGTKKPFGIKFNCEDKKIHLYLKTKGNSCWLAASA